MNKRTGIWPRICSALVMAVASGVVWGVVLVWCGYLFSQFFGSKEQVYEVIMVSDDGTPVIQSTAMWPVQEQSFRTLDGKPFDSSGQQWLTPGTYRDFPRPRRLFESPISWSQRIASLSDNRRHATSWYLIRDAEPFGHAYFVGYDELSKLSVGYIGRQGFRRTLPPQAEWFDLGRNLLDWSGGALASSSYIQTGGRAYLYGNVESGSQRLPLWRAFLIDGDRLLEIDLRARTVRTLFESPDMLDVNVVTEPPPASQAEGAAANPPAAADPDSPNFDPDAPPRTRTPVTSRVALRFTDRLVILDPPTGENREFTLPESVRERPIQAYVIGPDELILQWWEKENNYYGPTELAWLKPDGTIARQQRVALAYQAAESETVTALMAAGVAPVPIGWLIVNFTVVPISMRQMNQAATYGDALAKIFGVVWPAIIVVIVVGVVLAWVTSRLQRKYRRPATGAWTALVLLLGVPGFIAYWLEHRRPKLEPCTACGEIVPRDRDACAACDAQFPAPPLVGTEIFA